MRRVRPRGEAVVALLACAACHNSGSSLSAAEPAVALGASSVDFGNVYVDAAPERSFTVLKAGDAPDTVSVAFSSDGGLRKGKRPGTTPASQHFHSKPPVDPIWT